MPEIAQTPAALVEEREKTHGPWPVHARITQAIKAIIVKELANHPGKELSPGQKEALDMIAHKIGRIVAGDPDFKDHWDDIAGYAHLVAQQLGAEAP